MSDIAILFARAKRLQARRPSRAPPLLVLTDPVRMPDPIAVVQRLPRGTGLVYRHFGDPAALARGRALMTACRRRGVVFLVGADVGLARALRANGVHLPASAVAKAAALRKARPGWIITAAWRPHRGEGQILSALDAVLLSAVFPSASPSASAPLGPRVARRWVQTSDCAVYALGGVHRVTARALASSSFAGLALVGAAVRT